MKKIFSPYLLGLLYLVAGAGLTLAPVQAQSVEDSKMQRDLAMMEKAISEVFRSGNPDKDRLRVSTRKVDAQYTAGFGILIRTPLFYWNDNARAITVTGTRYPGQVIKVTPQGGVIASAPKSDEPEEEEESEEDDELSQEEIDDQKIEMMQYFLMNYGDLASELPKNERIMLIYGHRVENNLVTVGRWTEAPTVSGYTSRSRSKSPSMISMSVMKDDVDKLRQRNISEEDFTDAISIEHIKEDDQKRMAFDILGQIMQEVTGKHKLTAKKGTAVNLNGEYAFATSFGQPTASYEILAGYGVVYSLKLRKSGLRLVGTTTRKGGNLEIAIPESDQYDKNLDSLYKEIVLDLQESMIEYGRTLRDLKKNEWLVVKLDIPGCEKCDSPAEIEIRVPQQVLEDFDRRNISLDTALDRMDITSRGKAKDKSSENLFYWNEWDEE